MGLRSTSKPQPKSSVSLIGKRETSVSVGDSTLAKSWRLKQEGRKCYVGRELKSLLSCMPDREQA